MKHLGPSFGSGPSAETELRVAGQHSPYSTELGHASSPSPSPSNTSTRYAAVPLRIVIEPTASGQKWIARLGTRVLRVTAWPFVMSARLLLGEGHPADAVIELWRPKSTEWALRGRLGAVATTVIDGETASRCAKNEVSIRFPRMAATTLARVRAP
jgi:hypothetical protein